MKKHLTYLVVAGLGLSLWLLLSSQDSPSSELSPGHSTEKTQEAKPSIPQKQQQQTALPEATPQAEFKSSLAHYQTPNTHEQLELLPLLEGTQIDGFLAARKDGSLIASLETRDFFDYFLSQATLLENPWHSIEQIHFLADQYLPSSAAEESKALLDSYLGYQELAYQYLSQPLSPAQAQTPEYQLSQLQAAQEELMRLRRQVFEPDVVEAFFALEEAYADYALQRLALMHDTSLTREEKEMALSQAAAKLPTEIRQSEARQLEQLKTTPQ